MTIVPYLSSSKKRKKERKIKHKTNLTPIESYNIDNNRVDYVCKLDPNCKEKEKKEDNPGIKCYNGSGYWYISLKVIDRYTTNSNKSALIWLALRIFIIMLLIQTEFKEVDIGCDTDIAMYIFVFYHISFQQLSAPYTQGLFMSRFNEILDQQFWRRKFFRGSQCFYMWLFSCLLEKDRTIYQM